MASKRTSTSTDGGSRAIKRTVLGDDVYDEIKAVIMDLSIAPGDRVGIDSLARELSVSPTPIREALARLEAEHLVSKEALRGYRTTPLLTSHELGKMFDFRLTIEPLAARDAARNATSEQREALEVELGNSGFPTTGTRYRDFRALNLHDERFHSLIFEAAGNPYASRAFTGLHAHLHMFRLHYSSTQGSPTLDEHAALATAIIEGDEAAAEEAMRHHLQSSRGRFVTIEATTEG